MGKGVQEVSSGIEYDDAERTHDSDRFPEGVDGLRVLLSASMTSQPALVVQPSSMLINFQFSNYLRRGETIQFSALVYVCEPPRRQVRGKGVNEREGMRASPFPRSASTTVLPVCAGPEKEESVAQGGPSPMQTRAKPAGIFLDL